VKITTREILIRLQEYDISTTLRTVQRDMENLSLLPFFGVSADKDSKPAGWYRLKFAKKLQIPFMDVNTAIAFALIESQVDVILPDSIRQQLEPFFECSRKLLHDRQNWSTKILKRTHLPLARIPADKTVRDTLYAALDQNTCIAAEIGHILDKPGFDYLLYSPLHPVGLMLENDDVKLIAHTGKEKNYIKVSLSRIRDVTLLDIPAETGSNSLQTYAEYISNRGKRQEHIQLELIADNRVLLEILSHPIGDEQIISHTAKNQYYISAICRDDKHLRNRLINYGSRITVKKPQQLVGFIKNEMRNILKNYE
jgi:hypothetical protein